MSSYNFRSITRSIELASILCVLSVACVIDAEESDSAVTTNEAPDENASSQSDDTDPTTGDGDPDDPLQLCVPACASVIDCLNPALPSSLHDEDNWLCHEGGCFWIGCNNDQECEAGELCREIGVGEVKFCMPTCTSSADCGSGSVCEAGACTWSLFICENDLDCSDLEEDGQVVVCSNHYDPPQCVAGCQTVDDCNFGAPWKDSDNFSCEANACIYHGCKAGECGTGTTCASQPFPTF